MKWQVVQTSETASSVAPLVGAWIEISTVYKCAMCGLVAPLVGAWIEIAGKGCCGAALLSLPLWERGLKSLC